MVLIRYRISSSLVLLTWPLKVLSACCTSSCVTFTNKLV